jgi:hypothetical protein
MQLRYTCGRQFAPICLIVAYIKHLTKSPLAIYEIMQILRISAFDKTLLRQLLTEHTPNQDDKNVKDQLSLFC